MISTSFRIAMFNQLRLAGYNQPHAVSQPSPEWLIVERPEDDENVIFISDTLSDMDDAGGAAPADLVENNTIVGLLARPWRGEEDFHGAKFIFVRHNTTGLSVPGNFFPADGIAEINISEGILHLNVIGRHAHSSGSINGNLIRHDIPRPAPSTAGAVTWHFTAKEHSWLQSN